MEEPYTYPQLVKYSCHTFLVSYIRNDAWLGDRVHQRFRNVLKQDELCPSCERRLEKQMDRTLHWLKRRYDEFPFEVICIYRNGEEPMTSPEWPLVTSESEGATESEGNTGSEGTIESEGATESEGVTESEGATESDGVTESEGESTEEGESTKEPELSTTTKGAEETSGEAVH
jgi:hypothetical protein